MYSHTTHLTIALGNCGDQLGTLSLTEDFVKALMTDVMVIQVFIPSVFCNDRI